MGFSRQKLPDIIEKPIFFLYHLESHRRQGEDMGGALTIPHSLWPVIPGMGITLPRR